MANEGIEIGIFAHDDPTKRLDTLAFRREPKYLDEIDDVGAGSFVLSNDDEQIKNDAGLLEFRNLVRVYVEGKCRGGFLIQKKEPVYIDKGGISSKETEISGEGLKTWLHDASVYPESGIKTTSPESRHFNFATARGSWYKTEQWITPTIQAAKTSSATTNPWRYGPAEWPDAPNAKWIWGQPPTSGTTEPVGDNYFRYEFDVATAGDYAFFFAADDTFEVYIDGELLQAESGTNWRQTVRIDKEGLEPGPHVFAIRVRNLKGAAGMIAAIFRAGNAEAPTAASRITQTGDAGWVVANYPDPVPGWSAGGVMLTLLNEAKTRGVRMAEWLTPTFTEDADSAGNSWDRLLPWEFGVGDDLYSVLEALEELSCESWIDPETLEFHMWIQRGYERAVQTTAGEPVAFREGLNLLKASESGKADIKNVLLVKTQDGWDTSQDQQASLSKYGRIEGKLEVDSSSSMGKLAASRTFELKASPEIGASYDIIPTTDIVPFQDFNVGDWVLAPGQDGLVRRRIMSISVAEDKSTGQIQYNVEFDSIFRDSQTKFQKWLEKIGGGSLGGDMASTGLPTLTPPNPAPPPPKTPSAPAGMSWNSEGDWNADGAAYSRVTLTWGQVTTYTDGSPLEGVRYEVWGRQANTGASLQYLASLTGITTTLQPFEPSSQWEFQVRVVTVQGIYSEYSAPTLVQMAAPVKPLSAPTAPVLSQSVGVVIASWDGKLTGPPIENAPAHFKHLFAVVSDTETGAYVPMGPDLFSEGDIPISGLPSQSTVWVKFVAVDRLGVESPASAPVSILLEDWSGGKMDQLQSELDALNTQLDDYVPKATYGNGINVYRDVLNFYDPSSARTGTLVIKTNVPFTGPMIQIDFEGAQLTGGNIEGGLSLYAYATNGGTIYNPRFTTTGEQPIKARFAKTLADNKLVVLLDLDGTNTAWRYLRFSIPEIRVGFNLPADLEKGWTAEITTDLTPYTTPVAATFSRDLNDSHLLTQSWRKTGTVQIDGGNIYADSVTTAQIAANAITVNELAAQSVTTDKMLVNSINGDRITINTLHGDKLIANTVTAEKIAAQAITTEKLKVGVLDGFTITGALIQTNAANNSGVKLNTSGLTAYSAYGSGSVVLNSDGLKQVDDGGVEVLRLGFGAQTGLSLRNPYTGQMAEISKFVFGNRRFSAPDVSFSFPVSSYSNWTSTTTAFNGKNAPGTTRIGSYSMPTTATAATLYFRTYSIPSFDVDLGTVDYTSGSLFWAVSAATKLVGYSLDTFKASSFTQSEWPTSNPNSKTLSPYYFPFYAAVDIDFVLIPIGGGEEILFGAGGYTTEVNYNHTFATDLQPNFFPSDGSTHLNSYNGYIGVDPNRQYRAVFRVTNAQVSACYKITQPAWTSSSTAGAAINATNGVTPQLGTHVVSSISMAILQM